MIFKQQLGAVNCLAVYSDNRERLSEMEESLISLQKHSNSERNHTHAHPPLRLSVYGVCTQISSFDNPLEFSLAQSIFEA